MLTDARPPTFLLEQLKFFSVFPSQLKLIVSPFTAVTFRVVDPALVLDLWFSTESQIATGDI